jgi:hypothetical protein
MRKLRIAQPSGHGVVIASIAFLFLTASAVLSAPPPKATIVRAAEPVRNEYLIMLNVPASEVPKVAAELTKRYGGEVLVVWQHAVKGFWLKAAPEVARHMIQDRRVLSCEENAVGHESGTVQVTKGVQPAPAGTYSEFGVPLTDPSHDHYLWHLDRISHRQKPVASEDFKYAYGSDGSGVSIYIIDGGVFRYHQEFYPESASQSDIVGNARTANRVPSSQRVSMNGTKVAGDVPYREIVEPVVGKDSDALTAPDPTAPLVGCVPPADQVTRPYQGFDEGGVIIGRGDTHGTACASVAAGRNVGVAKGATIVPVQAFNCAHLSSLGSVISGLNWTVETVRNHPEGAAVVSMSVFFNSRPEQAAARTLNAVGRPLELLRGAITSLIDNGIPVVVSANNQNGDACDTAPANLSIRAGGQVISVGALAKDSDTRWVAGVGEAAIDNPGSNYGRCVDLWAPGQKIQLATVGPDNDSTNGAAYRPLLGASGTSFSAPIVAGMIARLMSENQSLVGRNAAAVQKIYNLLTSSATRLPQSVWDAGGFGADSPNLVAYIGGLQITAQPGYYGSDTTLSVRVFTKPSTNPTYQWYRGEAGDVSHPVDGATSASLPTPDARDKYWVRVAGKCYDDGTSNCAADSIAAEAGFANPSECQREVRAQAEFLTRVVPSGDAPAPGQPFQQIASDVAITARIAGDGYDCSVTPIAAASNDPARVTGPPPIETTCNAQLESPSTAPDGQPQTIATVHVKPVDLTKRSDYKVTFTKHDPSTCGGGTTTVSVFACPQPRIGLLDSTYVWRPNRDPGGPNLVNHILDPDKTTQNDGIDANGLPFVASFQWFKGLYSALDPMPTEARDDLQGQTRDPKFVPADEGGVYWARVDGRCGWAASPYVNVVSCSKYVQIFAPDLPVPKDRPVILAARPFAPDAVANGVASFEWKMGFGPAVLSRFPLAVVAPTANISTFKLTEDLGGKCLSVPRTVNLAISDCHILADVNRIYRSDDSVGVKLSVAFDPGADISNPTYKWFNTDYTSWTWTNGVPDPAATTPDFRPQGAHHRFFARVTANCNGKTVSEDTGILDLNRRPAVKPLEVNHVPLTYYEFNGDESSVLLSPPADLLPGATTLTWYSGQSYSVPVTKGTGPELTVPIGDAGNYWVSAADSDGNSEASAMVKLVATKPSVSISAFPGTVIGTQSVVSLTATLYPVAAPVGTTYEWREALPNFDGITFNEDGTFAKDASSPVLNSDPLAPVLRRSGIAGRAAYWVRATTPAGITSDSDAMLIIVACDRPPNIGIFTNPVDPHVPSGVPITLFAQGAGRNLTYQWYSWSAGNVANPVGSGGNPFMVTSPDGTYSVHVTDDCGRTADAATTVYLCKPTIPNNVSPPDVWIKPGSSTQLSVTATPAKAGDALHYKWYPGNLNLPALPGQTDRTLTVSDTGTFLATVSSDCSDGAQSGVQSALMTVRVCAAPTLGLSPASHDSRQGTTEVLHVNTSGDAPTYQWYQGVSPDVSNPIPEAGVTSTISVHPNVDSDYWVRVFDHGACSTDSTTIHLTVCAPPVITTQPASSTVFSGQTVTLTVAATAMTAAPLHYTWFEVAANGAQEAVSIDGPASFTTPSLTTSRTWFVRVYSGNQRMTYTDSQPATIQICAMPPVLWSVAQTPVRVGEPFTLQIYAPAAGSDIYWYRGMSGDVAHSTLMSGPTGSAYTQVIADAPSTSYWVRVQKDSCYSDSTTFTLNVCVPSITQQPAAGPPITNGGSVTLSVVANTSPLTYQWYEGASGDVGEAISGATSASYIASPATDTLYWVRVTGSCGVSADSNAALVSVCYPPAIVSTAAVSQWAILASGNSTTVSVNATGTNLTYQWYLGNSGNTASPISATTSSLSVTPQSTTSYWVRVSGGCGAAQNSVAMVVNVCGATSITAHPQGSTITSGASATMSVTASQTTSSPMTYQWYRGVSGDMSAPVAAATSTSFTTPALTATTSYWVRVSCGICTPADSQTATVNVCNNAQPLAAPADQFIAIGQTATLTATGTGTIYQWYAGASGNTSQVAGGTSNQSSYNATPSVTTQYWAQIQNGVCVFRTQSATVNVCVPTITQQPAGIMINPGASTTLSVAANTPGLTYQWYVGNSGTTTSPIAGATSSTVTVSPSTATNYWVRVTGSCSRSVNSATATVTICSPPAIIGFSSTQSIIRNNSTSCFVTATGTNLSYQWYVGTSGTTTTPIAGATGSSVSVTPQNTTSYWAKVTGTCGTANSTTMLVNVCAVPTITTQPQGSIIFSGSTATMSVTASEATTAPVTYQWYRGATGDLSAPVGTNSTSYTTPALTAQTNYWVRVSCGVCNPADSQTATVSICYYPQNLTSPGDFYNTVGQSVRLYTSNAAGNTYQWYTGATGDTSHPYTSPGSPNMYYADVAPSVTTQYWAQVQNGGCMSRTAAANVYVCVPTFTQQPAGATITPGSSTTLSAAADTPGVTYQWYLGASGNTASPIGGATGPSVTVTPSADTSYWVRALGSCSRATDSAAATVVLCSPPVITAQPAGSVVQGGGATGSMWVSATGSNLAYQWYGGNSGDLSNPIAGATASNFSMWLQTTQKVWVRITGTCGAVNSNSTFVSVYPSFTQPPSSLAVGYDTTGTISFTASGTYMSYVWKNSMTGAVIATTTTPTLITPSITTNTYIYCQVWSGNVSVNTNETAVSVCYNQPNVSITKGANGACSVAYVNYGSSPADDYQWYQGARGDTSHLVGSGSTALYVCPTVATQYWLRAIVWSSPQVVSCYTDSNAVTMP